MEWEQAKMTTGFHVYWGHHICPGGRLFAWVVSSGVEVQVSAVQNKGIADENDRD